MSRYKLISVNGRVVQEHIHVWEQHNKRPLPDGYVIHHKDGNHLNNAIENLVLMTKAEHCALHTHLRHIGKDVIDDTDPKVIADRENSKRWYRTHRAELAARYAENRDEVLKRNSEYYYSHREEILRQKSEYAKSHREEKSLYNKAYTKMNAEKIREYGKKSLSLNNALRRLRNAKAKGYPPERIASIEAEIEAERKRTGITARTKRK